MNPRKNTAMQTDRENPIKEAINRSLTLLGADHRLLCLVGSWGDTLSDADVLSGIKRWNYCKSVANQRGIEAAITLLPEEEELLSGCCGAPALDEIHEGFAFCSACKDQAEFKHEED